MTSQRAALYLQIPEAYCRSIGGLRWANYGEAIEFLEGPSGGRTFAFAAEIALFLEGFRGIEGGVPAFGFVLHLLYLIGLGDRARLSGSGPKSCVERIAEPFRAGGCKLRNAGALCAWLCPDAPRTALPPGPDALHEILSGGNWVPQIVLSHPMLGAMQPAEEPGLDPEEFEALVRRRVDLLTDDEIRHWLRHGRGPAGRDIERLLPVYPRSVTQALSQMERRPRLRGIGARSTRLEGVLWIPSRRLDRPELQGGGYADVTTRGAPEQILPIQFALENEEFLRRFAEQELLYFHREEPRQPATEQLILLLDQGVRTWGDVRLVLSSAVLALARQAERRRIAVKVAATSNGGEPIDPAEIEPGALIALLEASDLSPHPGQALQTVLAAPAAGRRDVVMLTHPRSLLEREVAAAARLSDGNGTRLFSVSVDSTGHLELAELRRGLPVVLSRSRVDLSIAPAVGSDHPAPWPAPLSRWKGECDPIGFPFSCGLLDVLDRTSAKWPALESQAFDFDESGERIMVAGLDHLLFTCRLDGTGAEHVPLPARAREQMIIERTVIGVAGGFVVPGYQRGERTLAHYDFPSRSCVIHDVESAVPTLGWRYYRDLHVIVSLAEKEGPYVAIDLSVHGAKALRTSRSLRAIERARAGERPFPVMAQPIWTSDSEPWVDLSLHGARLDSDSGLLHFRLGPDLKKSVTPFSDGQPALKGGRIVRADQGGDVLAVLVCGGAVPGLYFISTSRGAVIGMFRLGGRFPHKTFALSRDGRRFAWLSGERELEVRDVPGDGAPVFVAPTEEVAIHFASLGRSSLLIREVERENRHVSDRCLIRWDRGRLEVERDQVFAKAAELGGMLAQSRSFPPGSRELNGTAARFVQIVEHGTLRILIDRYNHSVVFDSDGNVVCVFYVIKDEAAAWLPDGTCWGPRRLIGREPKPGAAQRIALALREAERSS